MSKIEFIDSNARCPQCGQLCHCFHEEIGNNRWYDRYALYCPYCQKTFYEDVDGGEPDQVSELEETLCPFCHVSCHIHRRIPVDCRELLYQSLELHGSLPIEVVVALPCPKCGSAIKCTYQGDHGAGDYCWTWLHECINEGCDYREQFSNFSCAGQSSGPDDSGNCPNCGNVGSKGEGVTAGQNDLVCVQVDCRCPYAPDWVYYPKDIIGRHRINANNPRAQIGKGWDDSGCKGHHYAQGCEEEKCVPSGIVVGIITDCNTCLDRQDCVFPSKKF